MSDVIISIPGATDVTVENAAASSVVVTFPASNNFVTTIIDRGILYGVTGAQGPTGPQGSQGIQGIPGIGIASGGSIGQVLVKTSTTDYITGWLTLDKTAVGLSNVDNTTDLLKPISNATQTALDGKQDLATNLTSISALTFASTSFVKMTAAGTFALDTNTYLTAESDTLASVTGRGNTTTNAITVGGLTVATNLIYTDTVNSRVGIGTTSPQYKLDVVGQYKQTNPSGLLSLYHISTANANQVRGVWDFYTNTAVAPDFFGRFGFKFEGGTADSFKQFQINVASSTTPSMVVTGGGLVGIGTIIPSHNLDVNGTARIQNQLTTTGSITASSAIARGVYMNQTLVAAANNDVLVGLDIKPTFTLGAFTGTTSAALRVAGNILVSATATYDLGTSAVRFRNIYASGDISSSNNVLTANMWANTIKPLSGSNILFTDTSANAKGNFFMATGNLLLQNGGTFTDAGYRLDVVGADSRFNGIRAGLGAGQVATNTVFGFNGLNANTTGTQNVAIGYQALRDNTTAVNNVAVGVNALLVTTIGQDNTAIGTSALFKNTASGNTSVGYWSLLENISGTGLVAIGNQALRNSTGNNNTAVGYQAGFAVTTGNNNTAIGASCAIETTTGIRNTYVGALITSSANAANNTAIGTSTVGTGNNNCIMGYLASSGGFGGSVVLGREAIATASNQFVIGSNSMPSGAVAIEVNTSTRVWNVIINGTARKILLA